MFERLTLPARMLLADATQAAYRMGSPEVEGAHLLLGLPGRFSILQETVMSYVPGLYGDANVTPPSPGGQRPAFGEEVIRTVAMARGISVGRNAPSTGSATLMLALLTLMPSSVEELLRSRHVDIEGLRLAVAGVDDSKEPGGKPPGAATWTIQIED